MAGDVASLAAKAYSVCRELDPQVSTSYIHTYVHT